jgi:arylsulfatase A-like enzyme
MKISIYTFIICLIIACNGVVKEPSPKPNILFMLSDDHTAQAWGIYGGVLKDFVENDNIKRIAEAGMVLDNVFCTNSICTPSRASILTGQYSHRNGVLTLSEALEPDSLNVAKLLQKAGYQTAVIGKWHLKKKPAGFDHFLVLPGQGRYHDPILKSEENWKDYNQGGVVYPGFSADVIKDQSINWLESRDPSKPFFLMTQFKATHEPFDYPQRNASMYVNDKIPEPLSLYDFDPSANGRSFTGQKLHRLGARWEAASKENSNRYPGLPFSVEGLDSVQARHIIYQKFVKDFMRSGAAIDQNIGHLLDYLEEKKLIENTIIIYTSDQGYFLGEHGFFDKRMIYEESLRMPFVISYPPEIKPGTRNQDIILNIDFASLFLDYAGLDDPPSFQGRSFRNNLIGNTPSDWRDELYYRYWLHQKQRPAHFGIRNQRYKLAFFYGLPLEMPGSDSENTTPAWEFYDLEMDPQELQNKYDDPTYKSIINELKKDLLKVKNEIGDDDNLYPALGPIYESHWN